MSIRDEQQTSAATRPSESQIYSIRRPEIARAITSCWISLVPSKIVWLTVSSFPGVVRRGPVVVNRDYASRRFRLVSPFPYVSRSRTRDLVDFTPLRFRDIPSHHGYTQGRPAHHRSGHDPIGPADDLPTIGSDSAVPSGSGAGGATADDPPAFRSDEGLHTVRALITPTHRTGHMGRAFGWDVRNDHQPTLT